LTANDPKNHSPDAHCNEYMAEQQGRSAEPQSGSAKRFAAFRHPIVIIMKKTKTPKGEPA
jgi:hypothetical protein